MPADAAEFAQWFRDTAFAHPLYEHDLYAFLASDATREQLEWFFRMECAGEAAFDDLVALAQVGTRGEVKMEMASNYWDEMGKGKPHVLRSLELPAQNSARISVERLAVGSRDVADQSRYAIFRITPGKNLERRHACSLRLHSPARTQLFLQHGTRRDFLQSH